LSSDEPSARRTLDRFGRGDLPTDRPSWWRILIPGPRLRWGTGGLVVLSVVVALLILAVFFVPDWLVQRPHDLNTLQGNQRVQGELSLAQTRNSVRAALVQGVGGGLVLLTFAVGIAQLLVARQGQLVDRFTKTIEQLGNDAVDVRLGGVFALQQIAQRAEYARPAAEILLAYLKIHATDDEKASTSLTSRQASLPGSLRGSEVRLRPDLQAALRILVRDGLWARETMGPLDLSFIDVRLADLAGVDLSQVVLLGAQLQGSNLRNARVVSADLRRANLDGADLSLADLSGADLSSASLRGARLEKARLSDALLVGADLRGSSLILADLRFADATNANLSDLTANGAKLDQAVLTGANLTNADLSGATLRDLRLDEKTLLQHVKLKDAVMDDATAAWVNAHRVAR
jgi:uncharacterized protein YjbI with pentapeptide repeats